MSLDLAAAWVALRHVADGDWLGRGGGFVRLGPDVSDGGEGAGLGFDLRENSGGDTYL